MELNREQVIKTLECCTNKRSDGLFDIKCEECPFEIGTEDCKDLDEKALALINELTEENERLRAERDTLEIYNKDYKFKNKELTAFNRRWAKECAELQDECDQIKADTVRKMSKRIKEYFPYEAEDCGLYVVLEQIAKEMLENDDDK